MVVRQGKNFEEGYTPITSIDDKNNMTLMDFGILVLKKGQTYTDNEIKEKAYLLLKGEVIFEWEGNRVEAKRSSVFDENPCCLHVPSGVVIKTASLSSEAEICVTKTYNDKSFPSKYYSQEECRVELGGKGLMNEMSLRTIRTIFDITNAPDANLVLGEVVHTPGRWSSYPPHHHPQPEIYLYKFLPEQGFGFSQIGEEAYIVRNNDTSIILEGDHAQVCAPGYAMYYIWAIRNLDNNPFNERIYSEEHKWLLDKNAKIWEG